MHRSGLEISNHTHLAQTPQCPEPRVPLKFGDGVIRTTLLIVVVVVQGLAPPKDIDGKEVGRGISGVHDLVPDEVAQTIDDDDGGEPHTRHDARECADGRSPTDEGRHDCKNQGKPNHHQTKHTLALKPVHKSLKSIVGQLVLEFRVLFWIVQTLLVGSKSLRGDVPDGAACLGRTVGIILGVCCRMVPPMENRPSPTSGAGPYPIPNPHGVLNDGVVFELSMGVGSVKQGREGEDIELPHHQHKDHALKYGNLGISEVVPGGHKSSAERDRNPHQYEVAEQCHRNVLGPYPFQLCGSHSALPGAP